MAVPLSFQLLLGLLLLTVTCTSAGHPWTARFGTMSRHKVNLASTRNLPPEFEIHYYTQTLDHFNYKPESYSTFQERYILNYQYWGGANTSSPIFVYFGAEIDVTYNIYLSITDLAARFKGLLLYIEVSWLLFICY